MTKSEIDSLISGAAKYIQENIDKSPDRQVEIEIIVRMFVMEAIRGAESDASRIIYEAANKIGEKRQGGDIDHKPSNDNCRYCDRLIWDYEMKYCVKCGCIYCAACVTELNINVSQTERGDEIVCDRCRND